MCKKPHHWWSWLYNIFHFYRVLTGKRHWDLGQKFLNAEPNSVWDQIYKNHMTDESFTSGTSDAINTIMTKKELLTAFFPIQAMNYYSKPCQLKVAWKSSENIQNSFAFPKNSPLVPFFKYAYGKIKQSGALYRINEKWKKTGQSSNCDSKDSMSQISFNKIVSLIGLLVVGIILSIITIAVEKIYFRITASGQKVSSDLMEEKR